MEDIGEGNGSTYNQDALINFAGIESTQCYAFQVYVPM